MNTPSSLTLHYTSPAAAWEEALPVGNGRLGAMLFGGVEEERIALNEDTLWSGLPKDNTNPAAKDVLPEVRRLLFAGEYAAANELCKQMQGPYSQSYLPLGDLWLRFFNAETQRRKDADEDEKEQTPAEAQGRREGEGTGDWGLATGSDSSFPSLCVGTPPGRSASPEGKRAEGYRRALDLDTALATVDYAQDGVTFRRETFVSFPDQALVVRLTADRPGALNFTVGLSSPLRHTCQVSEKLAGVVSAQPPHPNPPHSGEGTGSAPPPEGGRRGGGEQLPGIVMRCDAPVHVDPPYASGEDPIRYGEGMRAEAHLRVVTPDGRVEATPDGEIRISGAQSVTLFLSAATSFNGFDRHPGTEGVEPSSRILPALEAAIARPYAELRARHIADHQALFRRVRVGEGQVVALNCAAGREYRVH